MHSLKNSIAKRLYSYRMSNSRCAAIWQGEYWKESGDLRRIDCRSCRRFDARHERCSIRFGSPVRKCVTAAQEANLHSLRGMDLLEIGFGKHSIPRSLVHGAGGTWTGIEPMMPASETAEFGKGGFGYVSNLPFGDASFDIVAGIQSIEHWAEPLPGIDAEVGHTQSLREIHRVLKPGGTVYFCAPIHLHGHEMFIAGDIARIRALFGQDMWQDLVLEKWREDYAPLERYPTPDADLKTWPKSVSSYEKRELDALLETGSVHLLTIKARKK